MSEKLVIIDGHSLAHRAFFALPPLTTRNGMPTNAAYGFTLMLMRLLDAEKPDYLVVTFDRSAPTFRHEAFEGYKATRRKMPDELRGQFDIIRQILASFEIPVYEKDGYEADDVIGTLACQAARKDLDVLIFTGDRDAFQLIDDHVRVMITRKGITETDKVDRDELGRMYGLTPAQIPDLKGLMGDTSDNIPGVPGVGEKTAVRLLQEFGSIEELLKRVDEIGRPRERELIATHAEQARFSKDLATIRCDAPVTIDLGSSRVGFPDRQRIAALFTDLEFHSLARRVLEGGGEERPSAALPVIAPIELEEIAPGAVSALLECVEKAGAFAFQFWSHETGWDAVRPSGLAVAVGERGFWIPLEGNQAVPPDELSRLFSLDVRRWTHDVKGQMLIMHRMGFTCGAEFMDTMVMSYLADPSVSGQALEDLCRRHLGAEMGGWRDDRGRFPDPLRAGTQVPKDRVCECAGARLAAVQKLRDELCSQLEQADMLDLYHNMEAPLIPVLFDMESAGVALDVPFLKELGREFGDRLDQLAAGIYESAGEKFNLNSPKQLGVILFEKLGLPAAKKTKTGYSTDAEVLEDLAAEHPIIAGILEHRQLSKLKSTYVDALPLLVDRGTGRVHTTFNQVVTATGRLSSTDPNLQNIPVRTDVGGRIREAFIPGHEGWRIMTSDYSQIELRIMAHLSADPVLIESFRRGEDIHRRTASAIFGVPLDEVDVRLRDQAKAVNFGIIYGISGFGLAKGTGVSRKEAERFIQRYFERYSGVERFVDNTIQQAREQGYVTTLYKRRRYLPDLLASNRTMRAFAERTARNTPVQGTAADLIKLAMIEVRRRMIERGLRAQMLLQVHDELVFEVPEGEVMELARLVKSAMEGVCPMSVPLVVDVKVGNNWGDAKKSVGLETKE